MNPRNSHLLQRLEANLSVRNRAQRRASRALLRTARKRGLLAAVERWEWDYPRIKKVIDAYRQKTEVSQVQG